VKIVRSIPQLRRALDAARATKKTIGFVPTMGYFHQGHISLMRKARAENDIVVVSIYVNPIQFGRNEDLERYPRDLKSDCHQARGAGVDFVFCPSDQKMYPAGFGTFVNNESIAGILCGAARPDHFKGVLTVVCKLFNIISPDWAYFGQKDYQQACIIKQAVRDLNIRTTISVCPIVREEDGLAMSSRNAYLSQVERVRAGALSRALFSARKSVRNGERDARRLRAMMKTMLAPEVDSIEYIEIRAAESLKPLKALSGKVFIGLAARIGSTRLIDNVIVSAKERTKNTINKRSKRRI
jgi:pantoate--beta-alanine ligase